MSDRKLGSITALVTLGLFIIDSVICFIHRDIEMRNMIIICFICILVVTISEYKKFRKLKEINQWNSQF